MTKIPKLMRETDSAYSQTFCMVQFSLNPLSHGCFWKIKLLLHCCSSLAGISHAVSMHSRSSDTAGSLCQESSPRSQPTAFHHLQPHSLFCLQFISCILVQTCKGLQLGAFLVSLFLKAPAYHKSPETSLNKLTVLSYLRKGWILY